MEDSELGEAKKAAGGAATSVVQVASATQVSALQVQERGIFGSFDPYSLAERFSKTIGESLKKLAELFIKKARGISAQVFMGSICVWVIYLAMLSYCAAFTGLFSWCGVPVRVGLDASRDAVPLIYPRLPLVQWDS